MCYYLNKSKGISIRLTDEEGRRVQRCHRVVVDACVYQIMDFNEYCIKLEVDIVLVGKMY